MVKEMMMHCQWSVLVEDDTGQPRYRRDGFTSLEAARRHAYQVRAQDGAAATYRLSQRFADGASFECRFYF